ncbi:MAG: AAA family ATPase [Clostridia bacterium]|nr:AAA family ATPase [Clostridia bacterium]
MERKKHIGICVCGLNGCGKTTLGSALAAALGGKHMDIENYYFLPSDIPYSVYRTREEAAELFRADAEKYQRFVFSAVNGNMGEEGNRYYTHIVYLRVPLPIRMERIITRAEEKFGSHFQKGTDLWEQEQSFFASVRKKSPEGIEKWIGQMRCPVLYLDGTQPCEQLTEQVLLWIKEQE